MSSDEQSPLRKQQPLKTAPTAKVKHEYDFFVFETIVRTLVDEHISTLQESATKDRKSIV